METNLMAEEFKTSSDEEHSGSDDVGITGRSYQCVFCKRGFTTAQALGGHMNIHRKDRAKPRPNSSSSISTKFKPSIQTHPPPPPLYSAPNFLQPSGWGLRPPIADGIYFQSPQIVNLLEEDWRRNLSSQIDQSDDAKREDGSEADDDHLDLELRLGHDP